MCNGWFFIILILTFSVSYNIVRFFELTIVVMISSMHGQVNLIYFNEGGPRSLLTHSLCRAKWITRAGCMCVCSPENLLKTSFQVTHYRVNATWLRRSPTYSIYYIMVRCSFSIFQIYLFFPNISRQVLNPEIGISGSSTQCYKAIDT